MIVVVERIHQAQYYEEIATQPMIEGMDAWVMARRCRLLHRDYRQNQRAIPQQVQFLTQRRRGAEISLRPLRLCVKKSHLHDVTTAQSVLTRRAPRNKVHNKIKNKPTSGH